MDLGPDLLLGFAIKLDHQDELGNTAQELKTVEVIQRAVKYAVDHGTGFIKAATNKLADSVLPGCAASAAGSGDSLTGPLRIGLIPTVAPYILPGLLPELREKVLVELRGMAGCTHLNDVLRSMAEVPVMAACLAGEAFG